MLKICVFGKLNFLAKSDKISYFSGIGNSKKLGVLAGDFLVLYFWVVQLQLERKCAEFSVMVFLKN